MYQSDDGDIYLPNVGFGSSLTVSDDLSELLQVKPWDEFNEAEFVQELKPVTAAPSESLSLVGNLSESQWDSFGGINQDNSYENLPVPTYTTPPSTEISIPLQVNSIVIPATVPASTSVDNTSAIVNVDGPSQPTQTKAKRPSRSRSRAPKRKLYEIDTPLEDPEKEKKRLNAIKAKKNRDKNDLRVKELMIIRDSLESEIKKRDTVIAEQQQIIYNLKNGSNSNVKKLQDLKVLVDSLVAENVPKQEFDTNNTFTSL